VRRESFWSDEATTVSHRTYPPSVNNRSQRLLHEIENGAFDQKTSIAALLRKVIILGGQAGSEEMPDWASRVLDGYGPEDELPPYRRFSAPLCVDTVNSADVVL
jgi:AbiTii